jgi:hypothetical protein
MIAADIGDSSFFFFCLDGLGCLAYSHFELISSEINESNRQFVSNTIILQTVLYGSESWTLSKAQEALLGGSERKIVTRIYGAVQVDGI